MNAANLMNEMSDRISELKLGDTYKQGQEYVLRAADRARDLYRRAEDQLPEGSMKYAGLALAGVAIGVTAYRLGKTRSEPLPQSETAGRVGKMTKHARETADEGLSSAKEITRSAGLGADKFDFTPLYKLVKLWLIYKISL